MIVMFYFSIIDIIVFFFLKKGLIVDSVFSTKKWFYFYA